MNTIMAEESKKGRVVGIGGIFFKSDNPKDIRQWYTDHLGIKTNQYGALFETRKVSDNNAVSFLQWSVMKADSEHFSNPNQKFMINYRVENLKELLESLNEQGIEQVGDVESYEYGKFAWIIDPDGNKVELWEPKDRPFEELYPMDENNYE